MRLARFLAFVAVLLWGVGTLSYAAGPSVDGTWSGILEYKSGTALLFVVRFETRGNALTAIAASPYQGTGAIALDSIAQSATTLRFTIAKLGVSFTGTIGDGAIRGTFSQRGTNTPLVLVPDSRATSDPTGTWLGTLHAGPTPLLLGLRVMRGADGTLSARLDSPAQGAFGLAASSFSADAQKLSFSILGGTASFTGAFAGKAIVGTFTQNGASFPLTFTRPQLDQGVAPQPTPLPTPQPHFTSRDVHFRSPDGSVLAGTLTVPDGARALMPAFVFVHGSGPATRDGGDAQNPTFRDLSNALSNAGIVVLRYDKRGIGRSTGKATEDWRPLSEDAQAAIAFLRAQKQVDPKRIFLLGHSEGGLVVPLAAVSTHGLAGIILMAPPAIPMNQLIEQQRPRMTAEIYAQIRQAFRAYNGIDPANVIRQVTVPVLVLQGDKDIQVLPADLHRLTDAAHASHKRITVDVLSGDDHLFIKVPPGHPPASEYQIAEPLDPRVARDILTWMRAIGATHPRR